VDPSSRVVKFFNEEFDLRRKLNRTELDRFLATLSRRLEVVFDTPFTDRIIENVLCKAFRELSHNETKKAQSWCDTLLPGQQLYKFESNFVLVVSPSGETEEVEGDAIVNRFPYGDDLLTMEEFVSELGLPVVMPSESKMRKYQFYGKVWCPKVKFDVEFSLPKAALLSNEALETTKTILSKWIGARPIPRKRKQMST
jgi:hypothetical protein